MSDDLLRSLLSDSLPKLNRLGAVVAFDVGNNDRYVIDARDGKAVLLEAEDEADADCTIKLSSENLVKLIKGKMDPMIGFTLGRIKVSGSMGIALKLTSALD